MTSAHGLPMDTSENTNVEELIRSEGISDDEWQRIFELRYCTILVPFAEDSDAESQSDMQDQDGTKEEEEGEEEDKEREKQSTDIRPSTPKMNRSSKSNQEQQQLPTPKSIQRPRRPPRQRSRAASPTNSPDRRNGLPSPLERRTAKAMFPNNDQSIEDMDLDKDQDMDDLDSLNDSTLMPDDPLSTYLVEMRSRSHDGALGMDSIVDTTGNHNDNDGNIQSAEQKLACDVSAPLVQYGNLGRRGSSAQSSKRRFDDTDSTTSSDVGAKRRHWELSPSTRLLQPKQPDLMKQPTLATSPSISSSPASPSGLMKPRSYTPSTSSLSFLQSRHPSSNVASLQRDESFASNITTASQWSRNAKTLWTKQDWQTLEALYNQMDGNSMEEAGLTQIAGRFLAEQEALTGSKPRWTKEMVLTRCIALYRVRRDKNENSDHQFPFAAPDTSRRHHSGTKRAAPYPVDALRGSYSGGTSSSTMSEFRSRRRAEQNRKQSALDQGHSLKSVFKHRFASGLRTVGQLLPFWRDVEQGNTDIKEEVAVPLVPAGSAQSVIEAFENQVEEEEIRRSRPMSRSGSVLSNQASNTHSPSPTSIAEMIARGHSMRSASAAASDASTS